MGMCRAYIGIGDSLSGAAARITILKTKSKFFCFCNKFIIANLPKFCEYSYNIRVHKKKGSLIKKRKFGQSSLFY